MNSHDDVSDYISELISKGYSSLAREEGSGNLSTFKNIDKGLIHLRKNASVYSEDISKCVVVLRLLVDLRENIIKSKEVRDSQVPNIYKSVDNLNDLFVKSANQTIKKNNLQSITVQCEELLKAADEIRRDKKLKGLGVLDGKLKNVIGRLRKKAKIDSVFEDEDLKVYDQIIIKATQILDSGDLQLIGKGLDRLKNKIDLLEKNDSNRKRLLNYIRRFEKTFINKIKNKVNNLYKKSKQSALFDIGDILDEVSAMENLIVYHNNKGLNIFIKQQKKRIQTERFIPMTDHLSAIKEYVIEGYQSPFWQDYEALYLKKHQEREIFSDTFYDYTLKGLKPEDVAKLLEKKIVKLKALKISDLKYVSYEQEFEKVLHKLILTFDYTSSRF